MYILGSYILYLEYYFFLVILMVFLWDYSVRRKGLFCLE